MGFHLTNRVYRYVKGLTSTQQAILAYIAFRANDATEETDVAHFSIEKISEETCFKHASISNALKALKRAGLLHWRSGGRLEGGEGRAVANHYVLTLPKLPTKDQELSTKAQNQPEETVYQMDNASSTKQTMHNPLDGQCSVQQVATIIPPHTPSHTVGHTVTVPTDVLKVVGENYREQNTEDRRRSLDESSPISMALDVCGVNDPDNKRVFTSVIMHKDEDDCRDIIYRFHSELKAHEHCNLGSKGRCRLLMSLLQKLPDIR